MGWDIGPGTLSFTTGYLDAYEPNVYDPDQSRYFILNVNSIEEFRQFSQEVRFASNTDGPFEYIFGGYFHDTKLELPTFFYINAAFPSAVGPFAAGTPIQLINFNSTEQNEQLWSVFAQAKYKLTDQLAISLGGRYQSVKKDAIRVVEFFDYDGVSSASAAAAAFATGSLGDFPGRYANSIKNEKFTPEVVLQYSPTGNLNFYAKYAEGFKAGGFDASFGGLDPATPGLTILSDGTIVNAPGARFAPETVDSYEIGMKFNSWDNRFILNVAAFRSEYKNLQVAIFDAVTTTVQVRNAGQSITQGIEVEATYQATDELRIHTAFALLDAYYDEFTSGPCTIEQTNGIEPGCNALSQRDLTDEDLPFSPSFSGTLAVNYEVPVFNNYLFSGNWSINYSDAYFSTLDNDPDFRVPNGIHMNFSANIGDIDDRWRLGVLVKNLTDKDDFTAGINWPFATGSKLVTRERPRTIAITANYNF